MRLAVVSMAIVVGGCGAGAPPRDKAAQDAVKIERAAVPASAPTPAGAPSAPSAPTPAATPAIAAPADSSEAAADVLRRYYAAIDRRRFAEAYAAWEPGAAGIDADAFAASFAGYRRYHAEVGTPGRIDAGAGQRYVTIPVRSFGTKADGTRFAMAGEAVLHRAGDIDGASAAQRRWRIRSIEMADAGE